MGVTCRSLLIALPYELLLAVSTHLEYAEVAKLRQTCKILREFCGTRPVYRRLAESLLRRCRALPLTGFQRLSELSSTELVRVVDKATKIETAWTMRTPRLSSHLHLSTPAGEEVDWLSPIASAYVLCSTKSGRVYCWDTDQDKAVAVYNPNLPLELWKCRVEFDAREVYFTMARNVSGTRENRLTEFVIMRLTFSSPGYATPPVFDTVATFHALGAVMNVFLLDPLSRIMSVFIWLPTTNTLGLYVLPDWNNPDAVYIDTGVVCVHTGNWSCILYESALIVHEETPLFATQHIYPLSMLRALAAPPLFSGNTPVDRLPIDSLPPRVPPLTRLTRYFLFPTRSLKADSFPAPNIPHRINNSLRSEGGRGEVITFRGLMGPEGIPAIVPAMPMELANNYQFVLPDPSSFPGMQNPFDAPWFPDACHFVRQWWPTLPSPNTRSNARRVSCTVLLLTRHDTDTHTNEHTLAQHYFGTPLIAGIPIDGEPEIRDRPLVIDDGLQWDFPPSGSGPRELRSGGVPMRMWYVSEPFRIVCAPDPDPEAPEEDLDFRERPLLAVDFGHAVWIEWIDSTDSENIGGSTNQPEFSTSDFPRAGESLDQVIFNNEDRAANTVHKTNSSKRIRFVSFPPIAVGDDGVEEDIPGPHSKERPVTGAVHTLETPEGLDLDSVETINVDQSQGAVLLSVSTGKVWVLYFE